MLEQKTIQVGYQVFVADCESNRSNNFWAPLIGCYGSVIRIEGDGLIDVVLTTKDKYVIQPTGISPSRFAITPPTLHGFRKIWKHVREYFQ